MILELAKEARLRRGMPWALVEHAADMSDEGDVALKRIGEDLLAALQIGVGEIASDRRYLDIAAADLGKAQELQCLDQHHQLVGLKALVIGQMRQVGTA